MNMSTFLRPKWILMGIQEQFLSFLSVCFLIWLLFVIKNKERVMLVWELECVQQGGSCGSLGMVVCESREQETKFKGLGADAKWQMKVGEPAPPLADNKLLNTWDLLFLFTSAHHRLLRISLDPGFSYNTFLSTALIQMCSFQSFRVVLGKELNNVSNISLRNKEVKAQRDLGTC